MSKVRDLNPEGSYITTEELLPAEYDLVPLKLFLKCLLVHLCDLLVSFTAILSADEVNRALCVKNESSSRLVDLLQTNPKCGRLKLCKLDGCRLLEQRLTLRVLRQQLAITVLLCKVASNCTALEEFETIIVLLQMGHLSVNSSARKNKYARATGLVRTVACSRDTPWSWSRRS